tara:strand:+ start:631 stop:834 length:204 start_codon:yes stop_codon:yes gene_type:complete
MKKYVNGVLTDMTAEEISARQAEVTAAKQIHTARNAEAETSVTKKASAKTKLKALGLDDAELKTLGL